MSVLYFYAVGYFVSLFRFPSAMIVSRGRYSPVVDSVGNSPRSYYSKVCVRIHSVQAQRQCDTRWKRSQRQISVPRQFAATVTVIASPLTTALELSWGSLKSSSTFLMWGLTGMVPTPQTHQDGVARGVQGFGSMKMREEDDPNFV